jgi:hypothetical protein
MKKIISTGMPVLLAGLLLAGCKGDGIFDKCGDEKEVVINLTADDIQTFADSLPSGYHMYISGTTTPSTIIVIHFNHNEGICLDSPVEVMFEASFNQVPYEGDVSITGIAGAGGSSIDKDLLFVNETSEEILFSADTVLELAEVDYFDEEPFFYTGVRLEVGTGGTQEDDMTYLYKVFKQIKVTATYKVKR